MIQLLLLLPVANAAKMVRNTDEQMMAVEVTAKTHQSDLVRETAKLSAEAKEIAAVMAEDAAEYESSVHGKFERRGGLVPGCEYVVVDHATVMALWVEDQKPLPDSLQADEVVFKCRDGYSKDGRAPDMRDPEGNMHVHIKCNDKKSSGSRRIASCKPVQCAWDEDQPLFNHLKFDAQVLIETSPLEVVYDKGTKERTFIEPVKEWKRLMDDAVILGAGASDPKALYVKTGELYREAFAGHTTFPGGWSMPQTPREMLELGASLDAAAADDGHEFSAEAKDIQALEAAFDGKKGLTNILKTKLKENSPCLPLDKSCLVHFNFESKGQMKQMLFATIVLRARMHAAVIEAAKRESRMARLGHGTTLWLTVKDEHDLSFDGKTKLAHTRNVVLKCDATGGLAQGVWYIDHALTVEKTGGKDFFARSAQSFAPDAADDGAEALDACAAHVLKHGHRAVTTAEDCHKFVKVEHRCEDGTAIPAEQADDYHDMRMFCARRNAGVVARRVPDHVEPLVAKVRAFPIQCDFSHLQVLRPAPCPDDGTYGDALDLVEEGAKREALFAEMQRPGRGHPCGLSEWGGIEVDESGALVPVALGHVSVLTCAEGYATNGADMTLQQDGVHLVAPDTELFVQCALDEHGVAQASQGVFVPGAEKGQEQWDPRPDAMCVPIQCAVFAGLKDHATHRTEQRAKAGECVAGAYEGGEMISHGCDVLIQCEDHYAFPVLTDAGEHRDHWVARCHADDRLIHPGHGCVPMMCTGDEVRTQNSTARTESGEAEGRRLTRQKRLVGEHQELLSDEPLQSGEAYEVPCDNGYTTDGQPYVDDRADNRAFVLECRARPGHADEAMRAAHLECTNCDHLDKAGEELSEEECQPVMCVVPDATRTMDLAFDHAHAIEHDEDAFGDSVVPYGTEVKVQCDVGYELYKDGELVPNTYANNWVSLGLCQTDGTLGDDPDLLHGLELGHEALGSGEYHCVKKPNFCPPLWGDVEGFQATNNLDIVDGGEPWAPGRLPKEYRDERIGTHQQIDGEFVFQCHQAHRVHNADGEFLDCEHTECKEFDAQVSVTCVADPENLAQGMYIFGAPVDEIPFHHGAGELATCVPQVCFLEPELNEEGAHDRSTGVPFIEAAEGTLTKFGPEAILYGATATYGCGAKQLVQRAQTIDSHVAGQECMKDDAGASVTLTCRTGWLTDYEAAHDPVCYGHCGPALSSRPNLDAFLTSVCTVGDTRAECAEGLARHYECDQDGGCRENAMLTCAAIHGMSNLGGQPGVGVKVQRNPDLSTFNLQCTGEDEAEPSFHVEKIASPGAAAPLDHAGAYRHLLDSCGKQLRMVWESERHNIVDVCKAPNLKQLKLDPSDGQRYTEREAVAKGKGAEWADWHTVGERCEQDDGTPIAGRCLEAVQTGKNQGELFVTECDENNVAQRFVYTTAETSPALGASGQLVSLLAPEEDDGEEHLWCVQMSEKTDQDPRTTFMNYGIAWCKKDHKADEELYCSGEPEHLPNCQVFRSNLHNFDPVSAGVVEEDEGSMFGNWSSGPEEIPTRIPPTNVFSYVQPMTYTIEIKGEWDALVGKVTEAGHALVLNPDRGTQKEILNRGRPTGVIGYKAAEDSRASLQAFLEGVHADAKVVDFELFEGRHHGMRVTFDFRLRDLDSLSADALQREVLDEITARGLEHRYRPFKQRACGPNERCGFLYFHRDATIYVNGQKVDKPIYECTGRTPQDACKYEMMFEAPEMSGRQRIPKFTYLLCHGNHVDACDRM